MPVVNQQGAFASDTPLAQLATQPLVLWIQGFAQWQAESIRFLSDRAIKDLRVPLELAACATLAEVLGVSAAYAADAASDYLGATQKLFALAAGDFEDTAAALI